MNEEQINDAGVFIESYSAGFMIADYRKGDAARYCGSDLSWRKQPITYLPFLTKDEAISAAARLLNT